MNYTEDQTKYMVDEYTNKPTRITVERLAKELDKTPKSIIGKLSREGVCIAVPSTRRRQANPQ